MFRLLKRHKAIKSFVRKLPLELHGRFGDRRYYTFEQVEQALEKGKYDRAFSAYAYALFCSKDDFDSYFGDLKLNCSYDGHRRFIAKRYFNGIIDFEGGAVVRFAKNSQPYENDSSDGYADPGGFGNL